MSAEFGDYVRGNSIPTEYALYAEVLAGPPVGITEIRGILVDKDGEPVWSYRQTPEDEAFQEVQPKEPMQVVLMLAMGLGETLSLQDPTGPNAYEGRVAQQHAERTGLPTESEVAAIEKALLEARPSFSGSKLVVFPTFVRNQPDRQQAAHLAEALNEAGLGKAEVAMVQPAIELQTVPNEAQRLWRMARSVREYLRQTPVAGADYTILADYQFAPNGVAFTAHFVVCDPSGEWVIVDLQNNHQPDFQEIDPQSSDDFDRLVVKRLAGYLQQED